MHLYIKHSALGAQREGKEMEVRSNKMGDMQECGERWQCYKRQSGFLIKTILLSADDPRVSNSARQEDSDQILKAVYKSQKDEQQCKNQ